MKRKLGFGAFYTIQPGNGLAWPSTAAGAAHG